MPEDADFRRAVLDALGFLVEDFAFRLVAEDEGLLRYESASATVTALASPHGEVELVVARVGELDPHACLRLHGMVGRASISRVVEILANELRTNQAALLGHDAYFGRLATEQLQEAEEWTAHYAGRQPQPRSKRGLP